MSQIVTVGKQAPLLDAKLDAVLANDEIGQVCLKDLTDAGKWVVLYFYPLAFTFVCPSEIIAFSNKVAEFNAAGVEVVGCAVDSVYGTHAWKQVPQKKGGIQGVEYPIISDLTHKVGIAYNCLMDSGHHNRTTVIIAPNGVVRSVYAQDPPAGRNVDEILRLVQAYQYSDEHGEVCPAGWNKENKATIKPDPTGKLDFFEEKY
jgi:peroxiredoxin (alkyl hydroperoxide reductase subunit C)